jgi:hypothetical protein
VIQEVETLTAGSAAWAFRDPRPGLAASTSPVAGDLANPADMHATLRPRRTDRDALTAQCYSHWLPWRFTASVLDFSLILL